MVSSDYFDRHLVRLRERPGRGASQKGPETTGFIRVFACRLGQLEAASENTGFYKGFSLAAAAASSTVQKHNVL